MTRITKERMEKIRAHWAKKKAEGFEFFGYSDLINHIDAIEAENKKLHEEAQFNAKRENWGAQAGMDEYHKMREERDAAIRERDTFRWVHVPGKQEAKQFYDSLLPRLREAAKECGYALGVHGSLIRDLDLIATPWVDHYADKETLARRLHRAACGLEQQSYTWEQKPGDRTAVSFPVCWPEWNEPNAGHIDLSVVGLGSDLALRERDAVKQLWKMCAASFTELVNKYDRAQREVEVLRSAGLISGILCKVCGHNVSGGEPHPDHCWYGNALATADRIRKEEE